MHQDIDRIFRDGLGNYSENPPAFIWENIEQNLNQTRIKRKRNLLYSVAASIALLLAFGAGYMATNINTKNMMALNGDENPPIIENNHNLPLIENENTTKIDNGQSFKSQIKPLEKKPISPYKTAEIEPSILKESKVESLKETKEPTKTNITKVKSSGTLLPPVFGGQNVYSEPIKYQDNSVASGDENLQINEENKIMPTMEFKTMKLPENNCNPQLEYNVLAVIDPYEFALVTPNKKDYSSWSVGIEAAPLVSYRDVSSVSSDLAASAEINSSYHQNYSNERPLTSYAAGVNVNYNISKRWKVQSGVYYAEMGQVAKDVAVSQNTMYGSSSYAINTSTGNISVRGIQNQIYSTVSKNDYLDDYGFYEGNGAMIQDGVSKGSVVETDFVQTYEFYEIPLMVNYTVVDRKLAMNVSGGVSANILYGNNTYVENQGDRYQLDADAEDLKNMNYSGVLGLGMEYPLLIKLKLSLQPTFRYSLSSINNSGTVYPYSFGIYTGLKYNF